MPIADDRTEKLLAGDVKADGWSERFDQMFIGRASAIESPGGVGGRAARIKATRAAFEDAAAKAFGYVVGEYRTIVCEPGCAKSWYIFPGKRTEGRHLDKLLSFVCGGLHVETVRHFVDPASVNMTMHRCEVTLRCDFKFECRPGPEKAEPDRAQLLRLARGFFEMSLRATKA